MESINVRHGKFLLKNIIQETSSYCFINAYFFYPIYQITLNEADDISI